MVNNGVRRKFMLLTIKRVFTDVTELLICKSPLRL